MATEFQVGDYVSWNNQVVPGKDNWITCSITQVGKPTGGGATIYRLKPIERQPNVSDFWVGGDEVRSAPGFCMVCRRNIGLEDNKLKAHNKGAVLCYGSYMPGSYK